MRALIGKCLKNWQVPIPALLEAEFLQFQYEKNVNFIRLINLSANLAFLSYAVADYLVVPDVARLSLLARSVFCVLVLLGNFFLIRRLKNIVLLELLLPLSITLASLIWFEVLLKSQSELIPTYLYASVIFIVLLNIGIRVKFLTGLLTSALLSGVIFYYVNRLNGSNGTAMFVYTLVYVPVLLFSLFIGWHVAYTGRQLFLHSRIEAMDRSDLQHANRRLWTQSHTDSLTGLANRVLLDDRIQQGIAMAQRNQRQLALMFIDLDNFKPVNDGHGHEVGDLLLQAVARRMSGCVRASDTVARIGGDEFVVLLPEVETAQSACQVATKICNALRQPFDISGVSVQIGASIGVAMYPDGGTDGDALRRQADAALYRAKAQGRNGVELAV